MKRKVQVAIANLNTVDTCLFKFPVKGIKA